MALTYNPTGFISSSSTTSAVWSGSVSGNYQISPTDTTVISTGDLVTVVGGYVTKYTVVQDEADLPILGVFMGCNYIPASVGGNYALYFKTWPGLNDVTTGTYVFPVVEDDPDLIFKAQANSPTGVFITADLKNTRIAFDAGVAATALGLANGTSIMGVDIVGTAPVAAHPEYSLKIVGVFDGGSGYSQPLNNWSTTGPNAVVIPYPVLLCKINNHVYRSGTAGMA